VWESVEGYLQIKHGFRGTLQALAIHADGTIAVEVVHHEQIDTGALSNIIEDLRKGG
jgi:hypothetical protein